MTFLFQLNIESKKLKYCIFRHCIEFGLSSILTKCPCHNTIVGKIITSRCSPFNSASNHMLNINIKCSKGETIRLKLSLSRYPSLEKLVELCQRGGIHCRQLHHLSYTFMPFYSSYGREKKVRISLKTHFTINEKIHFLPHQWTNISRIGRYFKIFFVKSLSLWEITIIFGISASKYTENTRHHQKTFPTKFRPGVPQAKTEKKNPLGGYRPNFVENFF